MEKYDVINKEKIYEKSIFQNTFDFIPFIFIKLNEDIFFYLILSI